MKFSGIQGLLYGALLAAALVGAPALVVAKRASTTVTCNDGTTSKSGRGACRGHGGVNKSASSSGAASTASSESAAAPASDKSMSRASASGESTVTCKDGTTSKGGRGACRGHGGVNKSASGAGAAMSGGAMAAPAATAPAASSSATAASGGGAGQVWVNSATHVYHCAGTKWYGKTKHGQYMTESQAKAAGDRPDHGKPCP